MAGGAA
ncbi:hypothetical protein YPPY66_3456, partial [Yersinia pestis PY-66]